MDRSSKIILAVIAISLTAIAVKLWEPTPANSGVFSSAPTIGDLYDLKNIKDSTKRQEARTNLMRSIPLVRVQGGHIDADIN